MRRRKLLYDEAYYLNEDDFEAALGMASAYEGLGDKYLMAQMGLLKILKHVGTDH